MRKALILCAAALIPLAGCDLPSSPEEARERLARGQDRVVSFEVPLPAVNMSLSRVLERLDDSGAIDRSTMSVDITPAPFRVDIGEFLEVDPVSPAPIVQSFDLSVEPYELTADIEGDAVELSLPDRRETTPVGTSGEGTIRLPEVDYTDEFSEATFARGSAMRIRLETDASTELRDVSASILTPGGERLASSEGTETVTPGSAVALFIPLPRVTLPGRFVIEFEFSEASGPADGENLTVQIGFVDAAIRSATGVRADNISPTAIEEWVTLEASSSEFSQAVLETGTLAIRSADFGSLVFTPSASGYNLAGRTVGGNDPGRVMIGGTIAAPSGATRLDVDTRGTVTADVRDVTVRSVTLLEVDEQLTETAAVLDGDSDQFAGIRAVEIEDGAIRLEIANRLPVAGRLDLTLIGATSATGGAVTGGVDVPAATGGTTGRTTLEIPLAGATLRPDELEVEVVGTFQGANVTLTREMADGAFTVDPSITMQPRSLTLENATGLDATFDQLQRFSAADLGVGRLEDLLAEVEMNEVQMTLELTNRTGIRLTMEELYLTLVGPDGVTPVRDADGNPIRVLIDQGGTGVFTVAAHSTESVTVPASALINGLIRGVLSGDEVGLRSTGTTTFAGSTGTIGSGDDIEMAVAVHAPLDMTLPPEGIVMEETLHDVVTPPGRPAQAIADLGEDVRNGKVRMRITNATPVAVTVTVAIAPTPDRTEGFDPFTAAHNLVVGEVEVPAASVDATGRVSEPAVVSRTVDIPTEDLDVLTRGALSVGAHAVVRPAEGGRARFTTDNHVTVAPTLIGDVLVGAAGGN